MPQTLGYLQAILGLNTTQFTSGIAKANATLKGFSNGLTSIGKTMTMSLTLPLVAIGGGAVKMAADFEKALSKVEGLVGIAGDKVAQMRGEVLALASATGRGPQELAEGLFFVTSAGLRGANALAVLEQSARAAEAGLGDTATIADLVTSAVNAYGIQNLSAAKATDILTNTVRLGKAPADALAQAMGQTLPIASAMGVSFEQVGAAVAAMTRTGTEARTASMQLKNILASVLSPTQQAEEALLRMGKSSMELRMQIREEGLLPALQWLATRVRENIPAAEQLAQNMGEVFPNVRALSGALDLMGSNAADNVMVFREMANSTGVADEAFNAVAKTASHSFNVAMAEMKTTMIELGDLLLPIAVKIVTAIKDVVTWFSGLSTAGQQATIAIAGILALAGPTLAFLGTMGSILAAVATTTGAVVLGIVALGAGILYLWDNWEAVKERISDWSWWKNMLIDMLQFFVKWNPFSAIIEAYNWLVKALNQEDLVIENPWEGVIQALEDMKDPVTEREHQFKSFGETISSVAGKAKSALADLFGLAAAGGVGGGGGETVDTRTTAPGRLQGLGSATGSPVVQGVAEQLQGGGTPFGAPGGAAPALTTEMVGKNLAGHLQDVADKAAYAKAQVGELGTAVQNSLNTAFVELGETLGSIFSGDAGANSFFEGLASVIASFMKTLGQAIIAAGTASLVFKSALFSNPFAAIAAGIALVAAATLVQNLMKKGPKPQGLATGGFVTQGGMFRVGEKGPELVSLPKGAAVTPNNAMAAQTVHLDGTFRIQGRDLVMIINNENRRKGNVN